MEQDLRYFKKFGDQVEQRISKLKTFADRNQLAYPPRVKRSHTTAQVIKLFEEAESALPPDGDFKPEFEVAVAGRLVAIRIMGKSTFAHIEDGTGRLQIYLRKNDLGEDYDLFKKDYDLGDFIAVQGKPFRTRTGEITVHTDAFQLASKALHPPPEKWHGITDTEIRYRRRYLDLIANPEVREIFRKRSRVITAMRRFLDDQGFLEVETPTLQPLYGGALARPFTTFHNTLEMDFYLRISDELYLKRLIVGGFDKVYEICKDFRNEGISTKHNPEFTMMECYWAYADYQDMMWLTEHMVAFIAESVLGTTRITYDGQEVDLAPPWRRLNLADGIKEQTGIDILDTYPDVQALWDECLKRGLEVSPQSSWGKLVDELLGEYLEPTIVNPTFIHTFPVDISPLSKQNPDDPRVVERFEAFVAGMEIANAYSELNDPLVQRQRFLEQQQTADEEAHQVDDDYVYALMQGMPPTGGLGVGVDRVVMLLTDQQSIREVILFPQMRAKESGL